MKIKEDLNSKKKLKRYITNEINRLTKLEYNGIFEDLTGLHTDYFAYLYDKDDINYF